MGRGSSPRLRRLAAWTYLVHVKVIGSHRNQAKSLERSSQKAQNSVAAQLLQSYRDSGQWREQWREHSGESTEAAGLPT